MATRGRFVNRDIVFDRRFNSLKSDGARLTWLLAMLHCDVKGRLMGDPIALRAVLFPRRQDVTPEDVETYLDDWESVGLAIRYDDDRDTYLYFPDFLNHNKVREDRERASKYPEPSKERLQEYSGSYPGAVLANSGLSISISTSISSSTSSPNGKSKNKSEDFSAQAELPKEGEDSEDVTGLNEKVLPAVEDNSEQEDDTALREKVFVPATEDGGSQSSCPTPNNVGYAPTELKPFDVLRLFGRLLTEAGCPKKFDSSKKKQLGLAKTLLGKVEQGEVEAILREYIKMYVTNEWERKHNRTLAGVLKYLDDIRAEMQKSPPVSESWKDFDTTPDDSGQASQLQEDWKDFKQQLGGKEGSPRPVVVRLPEDEEEKRDVLELRWRIGNLATADPGGVAERAFELAREVQPGVVKGYSILQQLDGAMLQHVYDALLADRKGADGK